MTTWSGSAIWCTREAMFTPSPSSLSSSTMASSMLMPTRMWIGLARSPARRSSSRCSRSMAQRTASTALGNSTSTASPATSISRPPKALMLGSISSRCTDFHADTAAASSRSIRRVQPTTSAKAIAARRRTMRTEVSKPDSRVRDHRRTPVECAPHPSHPRPEHPQTRGHPATVSPPRPDHELPADQPTRLCHVAAAGLHVRRQPRGRARRHRPWRGRGHRGGGAQPGHGRGGGVHRRAVPRAAGA